MGDMPLKKATPPLDPTTSDPRRQASYRMRETEHRETRGVGYGNNLEGRRQEAHAAKVHTRQYSNPQGLTGVQQGPADITLHTPDSLDRKFSGRAEREDRRYARTPAARAATKARSVSGGRR